MAAKNAKFAKRDHRNQDHQKDVSIAVERVHAANGLPLNISFCVERSPFANNRPITIGPYFVTFVLFVVKSLQSLLLAGDFLH